MMVRLPVVFSFIIVNDSSTVCDSGLDRYATVDPDDPICFGSPNYPQNYSLLSLDVAYIAASCECETLSVTFAKDPFQIQGQMIKSNNSCVGDSLCINLNSDKV